MGNENQTTGASGGSDQTPELELKDGAIFLDGRKVVYESDLIAAKKSLETQLSQAQSAFDTAKLDLTESQKTVATLNARIQELGQARQTGAVSEEEYARVKQELETAKSSLESASTNSQQALEYRRALIALQYNISADTVKDKDMKSLDAFEEALKAVATTRGKGPGNYFTGGGGGQQVPTGAPIDLARQAYSKT